VGTDGSRRIEGTRVLQIVESLDNRAVESWLVRIFLRSLPDHPSVHWTFFCILPRPGELEDKVRAAGGRIIRSRHEIGRKAAFLTSLRRVMREGAYDVLHCHHDITSAAYLLASINLPFRRRIVHLHNTALALPTSSVLKTALYREPMRQTCLHVADRIVGISEEALHSITGGRKRKKGRDLVVHYGIETEGFAEPPGRSRFRAELGLNPGTRILLFVGRMVDYKNPRFALGVLADLHEIGQAFAGVFVGKGELRQEIQNLAIRNNLEAYVRILGFRRDVPRIMLASDVLIWPSLEDPKEGLGLGIIEAQAAGLPVLMSRSVPAEAVIVQELVKTLPLAAGTRTWAEAIVKMSQAAPVNKAEALERVESSTFSMSQGVSNIMDLYR